MPCLLKYLVLVIVCAKPEVAATQVVGYSSTDPADFSGQTVSIVQLLANPLRYSGKKVRVIGYVTFEFEGESLYLHKEDFDHQISENAMRIAIPADMSPNERAKVDRSYVICEGTFVALSHGHSDIFANGTLTKITRLQKWHERARPH